MDGLDHHVTGSPGSRLDRRDQAELNNFWKDRRSEIRKGDDVWREDCISSDPFVRSYPLPLKSGSQKT